VRFRLLRSRVLYFSIGLLACGVGASQSAGAELVSRVSWVTRMAAVSEPFERLITVDGTPRGPHATTFAAYTSNAGSTRLVLTQIAPAPIPQDIGLGEAVHPDGQISQPVVDSRCSGDIRARRDCRLSSTDLAPDPADTSAPAPPDRFANETPLPIAESAGSSDILPVVWGDALAYVRRDDARRQPDRIIVTTLSNPASSQAIAPGPEGRSGSGRITGMALDNQGFVYAWQWRDARGRGHVVVRSRAGETTKTLYRQALSSGDRVVGPAIVGGRVYWVTGVGRHSRLRVASTDGTHARSLRAPARVVQMTADTRYAYFMTAPHGVQPTGACRPASNPRFEGCNILAARRPS
jgi:hypothetical protein